MTKLTKKQKRKIYWTIGVLFLLFYYFKDRPRIHAVYVDQQLVNYKTPAQISKEIDHFQLSFELDVPTAIRSYSVTIYDKQGRYHPNIKNIEEVDGLRGRRTFYEQAQSVTLDYFPKYPLPDREYRAEIIVTDSQGYQTRATFSLEVN